MRSLCVNTSLLQLRFGKNQLEDTTAFALAEALHLPNIRLQKLDLHDNLIGEAAGNAVAIALTVYSNLQELSIDRNRLGESGALGLLLPSGRIRR